MNWAHERYRFIYSQRRQIQSRGVRTRCMCAKREIFQHTGVPAIRPCILPRSGIETESTDGARHSPNCTYLRLVYIPKVPYRYIQRRAPWPNGRKMREYMRTGSTRGPTLCTRRESMRVQVRKSTVVRQREGGSVKKEERETVWPKVKPNSFSVRLEAAGSPLISLSQVSSGSSLSAFSLFAYYIRERTGARTRFRPPVHFYSERRVRLSKPLLKASQILRVLIFYY